MKWCFLSNPLFSRIECRLDNLLLFNIYVQQNWLKLTTFSLMQHFHNALLQLAPLFPFPAPMLSTFFSFKISKSMHFLRNFMFLTIFSQQETFAASLRIYSKLKISYIIIYYFKKIRTKIIFQNNTSLEFKDCAVLHLTFWELFLKVCLYPQK